MLFDGKLLKVILSLVLAASACLASWTASAGETLKIGGVGSSMGSMELLGAAFEDLHPGAKVMVLQSLGSGGGIMAVAKGAVDIAIAGRPLKEEERRLGLTATEFAKTPVVFAVKTGNALSGLSRADLIAMIKGDVTTWPDGRRARAVLRPVSDAETMIIKEAAPDVGLAIERAITPGGMIVSLTAQDAADAIEKIPGAFGISTLSLIRSEKRPLKILSFDGILPDPENTANGSYPFVMTYSMLTKPEPPEVVRDFVDFVRSAAGRRILEESGNIIGTGDTGR